MKPLRQILAGSFAMLLLARAAQAADFYAGKTVTFVIAGPAAGGSDLDCRLIAQYLADHVAGHPTIIARDLPGAAGMVAANSVGKEAKKDGTVLLCGFPAVTSQLLKDPALQVDLTKFDYVLGDGSAFAVYVRKDTAPGISKPADFLKAQNLILGGTQVLAAHDLGERLYLDALGLKYQYVTGLNGDTGGRGAIQQKFINTYMESATSYKEITIPSLVQTGEVLPLFQTGIADKNLKLTVRDPRMPDLPTYREFYQSVTGKPAQGQKIEMLDAMIGVLSVASNVLALPPGAPKEAGEAFRAAVGPLNQDKDFLAAAEKVRGPGASELGGDTVRKTVNSYLDMPQGVVDQFNAMIKTGNEMVHAK